MVVVSIEYPSIIHEMICMIGHLIVLVGAGWKCISTTNEIATLGFKKYFQALVRNFDHLLCMHGLYRILVYLKIVLDMHSLPVLFLSIFFVYWICQHEHPYLH